MKIKTTIALCAGIVMLTLMLLNPVNAESGTAVQEAHNLQRVSFNTDGALALTVAPSAAFRVEQVTYKLNNTSTGNFTLGVDAGAGAEYDATFVTVNVATQGTSYAYRPDGGWLFGADDECEIAYANTDSRTVGVEVWYSLLP